METTTNLVKHGETVGEESLRVTAAADYDRAIARIEASAGMSAGGQPQAIVMTPEHTYRPGTMFGTPWTRTPRSADDGALDARDHLPLYQDVVTPAVRANATDVSSTRRR